MLEEFNFVDMGGKRREGSRGQAEGRN